MASAMTTLIIDQHLRAWLMFLLALDRRSRDVRRAQRDVQLTAAEPRADTLRGRTRHLAKAMAARDRGVSDGRVHVAV
jgi:hypothetical protein